MSNTYVISGSSSGIGRAIAECLLEAGNYIHGLARDHSKYTPNDSRYIPHVIDFSDIKSLEAKLKSIQKEISQCNGIIVNAGYGDFKELEQFSVADMQNMINVNFLGQAILVKTFLPVLKKTPQGKLIFIASESALQGSKKGSMYCASKFALRGFAQSVRKECQSANVAVSIINPGFVDSPFFDNLKFRPGHEAENSIDPKQIAEFVQQIIQTDNRCVIEEINLQPLKKVIK